MSGRSILEPSQEWQWISWFKVNNWTLPETSGCPRVNGFEKIRTRNRTWSAQEKRKTLLTFFFQPAILIEAAEPFRLNKPADTIQAGKISNCSRINDKRRQFTFKRESQIIVKGRGENIILCCTAGYLSVIRIIGLSFPWGGTGTIIGSLSICMVPLSGGPFSMVYAAIVGWWCSLCPHHWHDKGHLHVTCSPNSGSLC